MPETESFLTEDAQRALLFEDEIRSRTKKNRLLEALMGRIMLHAAKDSDKKRRLRDALLESITKAATEGESSERIQELIAIYDKVVKDESSTKDLQPLLDLYQKFSQSNGGEDSTAGMIKDILAQAATGKII